MSATPDSSAPAPASTLPAQLTSDAAAAAAGEGVTAAAEAAAELLPVPAPTDVTTASAADVPDAHVAVLAQVSGSATGAVAITVTPQLQETLGGEPGAGEPVDLAQALRPALEAAAGVLGPVALTEPSVGAAPAVLADLAGAGNAVACAVVRSAGEPAAYVVLAVGSRGPASGIPQPRTSASGTAAEAGTAGAVSTAGRSSRGLDVLRGVTLEVTAEIGRTRMSVSELLGLTTGAVVELDRPVGSPADLLVNGRRFARGEVVVVDEDFAVRITEVIDPGGEAS